MSSPSSSLLENNIPSTVSDGTQEFLCLLLLNQANYETRILQLEAVYRSLEVMYKELEVRNRAVEEKLEVMRLSLEEDKEKKNFLTSSDPSFVSPFYSSPFTTITSSTSSNSTSSIFIPTSISSTPSSTPFAAEYELRIYNSKFRMSYTWCANFELYPRQYGVEHLDSYGNNILTYSNDARLTEWALQQGVNVHQVNKNGLSVMHFLYRVPNAIDLLCAAGGDINVRSSDGKTPIFLCRSVDMCEKLRQKGASLAVRDKNGNTLLHTARSKALYQYYLGQGLYPVINKRGRLPTPR